MKAVGIDIGTTTICAVLIDAESGELLDSKTLANDTAGYIDRQPWEALQNPELIWKKCEELVRTYLEIYEDVVSVGVTGQMHGIVYVDAHGNAVSPLYTWQDGRGDLPVAETTYAKELTAKSGYAMSSGFGLTTHYYHVKNELIPENAKTFCTIPDYIAMKLAGKRVPLLHQSMAASLGMYDLRNRRFDAAAVEKAGIDIQMLPEVTVENARIGKIGKNTSVSVAFGDNQASFMGAAGGGGRILLNVGTGSQISMFSEQYEENKGVEVRPYIGNTCLLVGCPLCGGYAYSLMKCFVEETMEWMGAASEQSVYEMLNKAAEKAYDRGSALVIDTRFKGSRQEEGVTGSVYGLVPDTFHIGDFACGILKGICEELYRYYRTFPGWEEHPGMIIGSGNGIRRNPLLRRICCDRFGAEMRVPVYAEEAAYGTAMFSLISSGYRKYPEDI